MGQNLRKATEFLFIFDGDCAFCTTSINFMKKVLLRRPDYQPFQFISLEEYGLSVSDVEQQVWLIFRNRQYAGHRALAKLLQLQYSFGWRFLGHLMVLPVINTVSGLIYSWIAKNRHKLPGGTPACQMPQRG